MLGMMYQTFRLTQQSGVMALEVHGDDPQSSAIFSRFPKFLANQVRGVRGYADRQLRVGEPPLDPRNRRVSVIVEHLYRTSRLPAGVRDLASCGARTPSKDAAVANACARVEGPSPH